MTVQAQEASHCQKCDNTKKQVQENKDNISALKKLKISGYIQAQAQWGEEKSTLKVGEKKSAADSDSWSRIGVRRGRLKLTYSERYMSGVFQINLSEKSINLLDAYLNAVVP